MKKTNSDKGPDYALRHIFTWAPDGPLEGPGLQCAFWAGGQQPGLVKREAVDALVESYSSPAADQLRCRQLLWIPETEAYALTDFTPLADSPDSRAGNSWAETLVVPGKWLEQGDWDAAAAFDSLKWLGPRPLSELRNDHGLQRLDPLTPGSLQRLARLVDFVPQRLLPSLLLALVQQSHGLQPLRLLEGRPESPRDLEEVVTLLPLVVPPACRTYRENDRPRCLSLRTRSPLRAMSPSTDITGYPAAAATGFDHFDGVVVDLGDRLPSTELRDRFGRDYVQWLLQVLHERDWDLLAMLYEHARGSPGPTFFSTFRPLLDTLPRARTKADAKTSTPEPEVPKVNPRAAEMRTQAEAPQPKVPVASEEEKTLPAAKSPTIPPPPAEPPAAPTEETIVRSPVQAQQELWKVRSEMEGAAWNAKESHRKQLEKLIEALGKDIEADLERAGESLKTLAEEAKKKSRQQNSSLIRTTDDLKHQIMALSGRIAKLEKSLKRPARDRDAANAAVAQADSEPLARGEKEPREEAASPERSKLQRVEEWLSRRRKLAWAMGCVLGLALVFWVAWMLIGDGRVEPKPNPSERSRQPQQEGAAALVKQVQKVAVADALLAEFAGQEDLAPGVYSLRAAIRLSRGIKLDPKLDCALVQTALRRQRLAANQAGIKVDGLCGSGTIDSLVPAETADCCLGFGVTGGWEQVRERRQCFLSDRLQLSQPAANGQIEPCSGESPWREGRSWTPEEAERALALFRDAAESADDSGEPELAKALRELLVAQSTRLNEIGGKALTPTEATRVLELAWIVWSQQGPRPLEKLSTEEIKWLSDYVNRKFGALGTSQAGSTGSPTKGNR